MSFKLMIEVPDSKLMKTLRLLNGHKVYVESAKQYEPGWVDPRKKAKRTYSTRPRKDTLLTMTGKKAHAGSKIEGAMELFEKFEKRKGIGTVTVQMFRDHLEKQKQPIQLQQRCVTEKFLSYA